MRTTGRAQADDATRLFGEYVERRERGQDPLLSSLLLRAGDEAPRLRRTVEAYEALQAGVVSLAAGDEPSRSLQALGRFRDLELLSHGGLSQVFAAFDDELQRRVALKVLAPQLVPTRQARQWALNEGRALAQLEHPCVVRVFDAGEVDGLAFIAMELVEGPSLRDVIAHLRSLRRGAAPADADARVVAAAAGLRSVVERCRLVEQIAQALAFCHAHGVVHRDVKPSNVLVDAAGRPRLIDFGLAHRDAEEGSLTDVTTHLMGTPAYVAPEQLDQGVTGASPLSDQFALGSMLYELLTLQSPFARRTRAETLDAISRCDVERPRALDATLPADLERVCLHALEREPGDRYASTGEMAQDLQAFLEHRAISLAPPSARRLLALWARRNRRRLLLVGGIGAGAIALLLLLLLPGARARRTALLDEGGTLVAGLGAHRTPQQFRATYLQLNGLRDTARRLDDSWLAGWLLPRVEPDVREHIHATSRSLSEALKQARSLVGSGFAHGTLERQRAIISAWSFVLALDAVLCPDCPYNELDRRHGTVELPPVEGLRLFEQRMDMLPWLCTSQLAEVDPSLPPEPGAYRLLAPGPDGLVLECSFLLLREDAPRTVDLRPLDARVRDEMVLVPGRVVRVHDPIPRPSPAPTANVEPFLLLPRLVTWGEVAALLPDEIDALRSPLRMLHGPDAVADEGPAVVPFDVAERIAHRLGGRLPTVLEARAALLDGLAAPPVAGLFGEWTDVPALDPTHCVCLDYSALDADDWSRWMSDQKREALTPGTAFRIAHAAGERP